MKSKIALSLFALALGAVALAQPPVYVFPQLQFSVDYRPEVSHIDAKTVLVYELNVVNHGKERVDLSKVVVRDEQGSVLQTLTAEDIVKCLRLNPASTATRTASLESGQGGALMMWVEVQRAPKSLSHQIGSGDQEISGASIEVANPKPLVLRPPFEAKGTWAAVSAPSNESIHRRGMLVLDSAVYLSQRFAIDWVLLTPDNQILTGDASKNESSPCFHQPALAVQDAVVVGVHDGLADNPPGDNRSYPITRDTIGGNWIALDLGEGRYGMYAHLSPGTLLVKKGDHVKAGQRLALIGNSGNSSGPHLHFHVCDRPSWLASEGRPYVFDHFKVVGSGVPGIDAQGNDVFPVTPSPPKPYRAAMPAENECVRF